MPAVDELLAGLAAHPPAEPTPVGEIRGRARRRTRRRRALAGAAAAVVLLAVGVGVGAAVTAEGGEEVVADDGGTLSSPQSSTTSTPTGPSSSSEPTLTLEPATGQEVGNRVRVVGLGELTAGLGVVTQCASEALEAEPADVLTWCADQGPPEPVRATDVPTVPVRGSLVTPDGVVACDDAPGRCVIVVALGLPSGSSLLWAPLVIDDTPPAADELGLVVDGDEGTVGDGDAVLITLTGVETGQSISVQQCATAAHPSVDPPVGARCDQARARYAVVEDGPETQLTVSAFHDVFLDEATSGGSFVPEWTRCEPCELVVTVDDRTLGRIPVVMEATDAPIRPALVVEPAGRHAAGATVTVRASGLQPETVAYVGWCPTEPPEGGGSSLCTGPGEAGLVGVDAGRDGTVVIDDFVLPGPGDVFGLDCVGVPGSCAVGIEGTSVRALAIVPLDLTG